MHNQTALRLRRALLSVPGVVITTVPWKLGEDDEVEGRQLVNDPFKRESTPTRAHGATADDTRSESNGRD